MEIVTSPHIDPLGVGRWEVRAELFGVKCTVFRGSIFACIDWRARNA